MVDEDSYSAGTDEIEAFGELNTIDALANGDITKYEEVLKIDVITCFTKLYLNNRKGEYEKRLYKVKRNKSENEIKSKRR